MSRNRFIRSRAAFTLVELLVVIGIIALLIGILLPTLSKARDSARSVVCLSNERQLGLGFVSFTLDHDGWMPKAWFNDTPRDLGAPDGSGEPDWGHRDPRWGWEDTIVPYLSGAGSSMDSFLCPGDATEMYRNVADNPDTGRWNVNYPDVDPTINDYPSSYRYNTSNNPWWFRGLKISRLKDPVNSIVFVDGTGVLGENGSGANWNQMSSYEGAWEANVSEENMRLVPVDRHNKVPPNRPEQTELNLTFADGHAAQFSWEQTWEQRGERVPGSPDNANAPDVPTMWRQVWDPNVWKDTFWNYSAGPALPGTLFK